MSSELSFGVYGSAWHYYLGYCQRIMTSLSLLACSMMNEDD
jgi:hypothetical protein